jgi:3,4-dihydroxy 2-butanone 4-phosphate synthase/3,4-dihydroxy 2-butanone 4-phosphate synthase/GTP cyclohydrolase II
MFSGRISEVGTVLEAGARLVIEAPKTTTGLSAGGSVGVNGTCLSTVLVNKAAGSFAAEISPETAARSITADILAGARVNLESDLFVKSARDLWQSARVIATRTLSALPWAGELSGPAGVQKCAARLAAGGGVVIHDPQREAEADVVFSGATLRPESMVFLLSQVCGHTTVPCDRDRLDRLEIPPMPGAGDRHGTAYHVSVDLAANPGTGVSAHERATTIRRLAHPDARPADFLRPGHVFPLAGSPGGLVARRGHTEASLALREAAGLPTVAVICEVMGPDGHMLTGPAVERFALAWSLPLISVDDLALHV